MKKFFIFVLFWVMILFAFGSVQAKSELDYKIQYDSKTKETYPLKAKIQDIYADLVSGVHSESYLFMVIHNLDLFEYKSAITATWKNNELFILEGDGNGDEINGTLSANSVCVPEVQPRSFLSEMFN